MSTPFIATYRVLDDVLVWPNTDRGWDHMIEFVGLPGDQRTALAESLSLEYSLVGVELNQSLAGVLSVHHIEDVAGPRAAEMPEHTLVVLDPVLRQMVRAQQFRQRFGL